MKTLAAISKLSAALVLVVLPLTAQEQHPHDSRSAPAQDHQSVSLKAPWNGRVDGRTYSNEYFGLEVTLPDDWLIHSKETVERVKEKGKDLIKPDDKKTIAAVEASIDRTIHLVLATPNTPGQRPRAGVQITAEPDRHGFLKTGADYLTQLKQMTMQIKLPMEIVEDIKPVTINGVDFYVIQLKVLERGLELGQRVYATIRKGYALIYLTTYSNEDERKASDRIVGSIRLN